MKSNRFELILTVIIVLFGCVTVFAQDNTVSSKDAPWLEGVTIGPHPQKISPVIPMKLYMDDGNSIPATLTEDIPVTLIAETSLFDKDTPAKSNGKEIPNPRWIRKPAISWYFVDWEKNKNQLASCKENLAINQMIVTPLSPTGKGAITCFASRRMRYDLSTPGKTQVSFATSSKAKDVRVLDITPPTCGLKITVKNGGTGMFWVTENPPNKYPPKLADVSFTGNLIDGIQPDEVVPIQGLELGENMVVSAEQAAISVAADSVLMIEVNGDDNYKLNLDKLKYGICDGAGGNPAPIGQVSPSEIKLAELKLPENPHLYIDASDMAGNRQVLFVPLKIK